MYVWGLAHLFDNYVMLYHFTIIAVNSLS
uniref:Uncharacterized protein n=1 Tax=Arundo donax TaxID=35708 RepID=A0A0A9FEX1_ARUDO